MVLTLHTIYQDNIDLNTWLNTLPQAITHINLLVPINSKHNMVQPEFTGVTIHFVPVDTPRLFLDFQQLYPLNKGWHICYPMHYQLSTELVAELVSVTKNEGEKRTIYTKEKGEINFLGQTIKKGGYNRDTILLFFYLDQPVLTDLLSMSIKKLAAPIERYTQQTFDNFHLELDIQQQLLSYLNFLQHKKYYLIQFFTKPLGTFLYRGVIRGGFFEGKAGFALTYLYALSSFKGLLFLRMKYKDID